MFSMPTGRHPAAVADEPAGDSLKACLEAVERRMVAKALADCGGNITRSASQLGLSRSGLQKKMRRYGLR